MSEPDTTWEARMKRRTMRTLVYSLCATLALVMGLALAGCSGGPSAEEQIRQDLASSFDRLKDLDDTTMEELSESMDTSSLEPYGIDGAQLIRSMVDGFGYTINDVTVDEGAGTAVATVSVTSKSMLELYNQLGDIFEELLSGSDALELLTDQDALNERVGELVMEAVDAIEPSEKELELAYSKADDGWKMDDSAGDEFAKIFVGEQADELSDLKATVDWADQESEAVVEAEQEATPEAEAEPEPEAEPEEAAPSSGDTTVSQQNALESAMSYLDFTHFSYTGLIDQLEYEGYSTEDATWAVDSCGADWNEQALGSAQDYLDFTSFSYTGLIDQLEYEGFTTEQATYAADSCGADWNEQAAKSAQSYLDFSDFSREGLIEQLEYEGFTHEQAVFGADSVGL